MNEDAQLEMIARELRAAGWVVQRDVAAEEFGFVADLTLDFVAKPGERDPEDQRLDFLIIEVPNRRRIWRTEGFKDHWAVADESEALRRIEVISDAISPESPRIEAAFAGADRPVREAVAFQVRFLDVSVDQAQARQITQISLTDKGIRAELDLTRVALKDMGGARGRERALVTAFLWCRWLRILGYRYPGRRHSELKLADLRTIQKDLFDAGILRMTPRDYFQTHLAILAVFEGGDADWTRLQELSAELEQLLAWAAKRFGNGEVRRDEPTPRRRGADLFDNIEFVIKVAEPDNTAALLQQLQRLRETDGLPTYRQALLDFEDLADADQRLTGFFPELRRLSRLIRD